MALVYLDPIPRPASNSWPGNTCVRCAAWVLSELEECSPQFQTFVWRAVSCQRSIRGFNSSIVHPHHKSLQQFHWFVTSLKWHALTLFENIIRLRERLPSFPGSLLSSASEWRYGITAGECVKYWESQILCWIHCGNNFTNSYVPKVYPDAKGNPKLIRSILDEWSHSQYHNSSINSVYGHLLTQLLHSICRMQK